MNADLTRAFDKMLADRFQSAPGESLLVSGLQRAFLEMTGHQISYSVLTAELGHRGIEVAGGMVKDLRLRMSPRPTWRARAAELTEHVAVGPRPRIPDWQITVDLRCSPGGANLRLPPGFPDSVILGVEYHDSRRGWEQHDFFLDSEQARALGRALLERAELLDLAASEERITVAKDPTP